MALDVRHWDEIDRALRAAGCDAELEERRPGWSFPLEAAGGARGHLLLDEGWAGLTAPLPEAWAARTDAELLELSGSLAGPARIGRRRPGERRLLLDVPTEDGQAAPEVCRAALGQLCADWSRLAHATAASPGRPPEPGAPATLVERVRSGGWICEERSGGRIVIDLETRDYPQQATAVWTDHERIVLRAPIARRRDVPEERLPMLAHYLLRVAGRRRLVGAAAGARADGEPEIRFEARLVGPAATALIDHALPALALTWNTCGREARALATGLLAAPYAALWLSE